MPEMYKILSIDGGGTKGIVAATFLHELEKKGRAEIRNEYDCFIGTSTGAILVAALAAGIPTDKIIDIYHQDAKKIFRKEKKWWKNWFGLIDEKYETRNLYNAIFKRVGDLKLGDLKKRFVFTAYDIERQSYVLFDSHKEEHAHLRVADCATASAAAPTYFEPHSFEGFNVIDGGVCGLNNPSLAGWALALNQGTSPENITILSVGNGEYFDKIKYSKAINWGIVEWVRPLIDIMLTGTARMANDLAKNSVPNGKYFRLNMRIPEKFKAMDAPENMQELESLTRAECNQNVAPLFEIITKQWK